MAVKYNILSRLILLKLQIVLLIFPGLLSAQQRVSNIRVVVHDVRVEKENVRAVLDIEISGMSVSAREQIYLFPVIRSGTMERAMLPVIINGKIQQEVIERNERLSGKLEPAYASFSARNRGFFNERITYDSTIPFEDWMKDAQVGIAEERRNCRCEFHRVSMEIIANGIRSMEKPQRGETYLLPVKIPQPPREEIKRRSETGEAQIIYTVNNAEIKPALGNNQMELDKIRGTIENIRSAQGVKINSIEISSYASPEGGWQNNQSLSERRAASLTAWIRRYYNLGSVELTSRGYGEDWLRLVEYIKEDPVMSSFDKEDVIRLIQSMDYVSERKNALMRYKGGTIYQYLLSNVYPKLRRSAYRIKYTVPEYTLESIRKVYKSHPEMLSLYEFYLLANEYDPESQQFKDIITKATRIYPNDKFSRIFMALSSYQSADTKMALEYLKGLENEPEAWLYFSAFHAMEYDLENAEKYALMARKSGNPEAAEYLRLINIYKEKEKNYQQELKEWEKYGIE